MNEIQKANEKCAGVGEDYEAVIAARSECEANITMIQKFQNERTVYIMRAAAKNKKKVWRKQSRNCRHYLSFRLLQLRKIRSVKQMDLLIK